MEELTPVLALVPPAWRDAVLALIGALITVRTALYALVRLCHAVDMRDGREDWAWVGDIGDGLAWFDRQLLGWLPVKPPFVREKS